MEKVSGTQDEVEVSILCLTYNHEKYIRDTLESFVMQECSFRFEAIVHDDCSTDRTTEIIREYAEKYPDIIKPIYEEENQYQHFEVAEEKINRLIKGKYLATCEGDDFWNDKSKLQKQYEALERHPKCSMSVHKTICCNSDGSFNPRVRPDSQLPSYKTGVIARRELSRGLSIEGCPFHTSSMFMRREVQDVPIYFPRDMGMVRRAMAVGDFYYIDEPMSTWRQNVPQSWCDQKKKAPASEKICLLESDMRYDRQFDEYMEGIYAEDILRKQWSRILSLLSLCDNLEDVKRITEECNINLIHNRKVIARYMTRKQKLIFYGYLAAPGLIHGLLRKRAE